MHNVFISDESGTFKINANKHILPFSKETLQVTFSPPVKDKLYSATLSATVLWGQYLTVIHIEINFLGKQCSIKKGSFTIKIF